MNRPATMSGDSAAVGEANPHLQEHFENLVKQTHAAHLGMWIFLCSEILFFAVLFTLYAAYRATYPEAFAEAARHTDLLLGTTMTYLLLAASFLVALAVGAIRGSRSRAASLLLAGATGLGAVFLALKILEYREHFADGIYPGHYYHFAELPGHGAMAFFTLYYLMTGLHFLHVAVGVALLAWLSWRARRDAYDRDYHTPLELGGMYWHFVDIVWLFLWPVFYLMR